MTGHPWQWFGGRTFAQHGDDLIFLNLFKRIGIERPSYLDIGAHHPTIISQTALLYERGSRGINVEANPALFEAFEKERPQDINLNCGVGPARGVLPFYVSALAGHSSFVKSAAGTVVRTRQVDVVMVGDIVRQHAGGEFPDILTIDTEGLDYDILASIDYDASSPKVICAEATSEDVATKMRGLLISRGYGFRIWAGSNMIFVRNDFHRVVG